jgi:hypothetical protein
MLDKVRAENGTASGRLAIVGATKAVHDALRHGAGVSAAGHGRYVSGLTPVAYAGQEFRAYDYMTVGRARSFYKRVSGDFDDERLSADLARADLDERLQIRRLKRAYARALALAIVVAKPHRLVVVEHGEQFDAEPTAQLLSDIVRRSADAIVTYAEDATVPEATFGCVVDAEQFLREYVR